MNDRLTAAAFAGLLTTLAPAAALADWGDHAHDRPRFDRELTGRVEWFRPYHLELEGDQNIVLHDGTVINPRGLTLHHGMVVRVVGHRLDDGRFSADEIDLLPRDRY